jgi:hypothetical protein
MFITKQDSTVLRDSLLQPYLGWIFGTNLLGSIVHILSLPPSAGEATRGYLHGHLLIDFVGQHGPTSKLQLLALDSLLLILQLALLPVLSEIKKLERWEARTAQSRPIPEQELTQTMDAEERGVLEDGPLRVESTGPVQGDSHIVRAREQRDGMYSGQFLLGSFWLFDITKWQHQKNGRRPLTGPSFTLSSAISRDMRQGGQRYTLNMPLHG